MCRNTIVSLLSLSLVCWMSLPTAGQDSRGGEAKAAPIEVLSPSLKAYDPSPPNGACGTTYPLLTWQSGDTAFLHDLYFGKNPNLGPANLMGHLAGGQTLYYLGALEPGTYYWRVDEVEQNGTTVHTGDIWCFTIGTACAATASYRVVNLCCDPTLVWPPAPEPVTYHVYFDDDQIEVLQRSASAYKGMTVQTTFPLGQLADGTTYYWCVDLHSAQGEVLLGEVRGFSTATCGPGGVLREWWQNIGGTSIIDLTGNPRFPALPDGRECLDCMEGPTDWADNYGTRLSALLLPPVSGEYTFWIAGDDQAELWLSTDADPAHAVKIAGVTGWTAPREWIREPGQTSMPISLEAGRKYYIEALAKEGTGGDNLAVAWQGPDMTERKIICVPYVESPACMPLVAHSPAPRDGDPYVASTGVLSWRAGQRALQHDVYFGDDYELVLHAGFCPVSPAYKGRQSETEYDPGPLDPGRTYYWRIDEVNPDDPAGPWRGCVWSFTVATGCRTILDDFEDYSDSNPIWQSWEGTPDPVQIERTTIHGGSQSMRMDYDTRVPPYYGEAKPTGSLGMGLGLPGGTALSLWFHGSPLRSLGLPPRNEACPLYVRMEDASGRNATVVHPNPDAVLINEWTQWVIPLNTFTFIGVNLTNLKEMAIGVGNSRNSLSDCAGRIYIDDICLR